MKSSSAFTFNKLDFFDGIELFEASQDVGHFPFHKHDTFCISIITRGTEVFENQNSKIIMPSNTVGVAQVNEIHKNASLGEMGYSYKTIYVNPELLAYFNNGKKVHKIAPAINDMQLFEQINTLFQHKNNVHLFEDTLKKVVKYKKETLNENNTRFSIDIFNALIEKNLTRTIDTDFLAKQFHVSKYHFIRAFKKQIGITPQAYITLFKLEKAKVDLKCGKKSITEATYDYGFHDLSHFSRLFKKIYGTSPKYYLNVFR